jgi:hypothetical protein
MGFREPLMWVKRTEEELAALELKKKSSRPRGAIFLGTFVFGLTLFFRGIAPEDDLHLASRSELPSRALPALLLGLAVGLFFYFFPPHGRVIVICDRCGKTKDRDSETKCSCGGNFEDIKSMKWQERV